jgi:hypothetical protein
LGLPAGEYEKAYAIQDRFFKENGEFFYPSYKGEPYYDDFITGENADWDSDVDGPTILAEFFGDFMVVNGKVGTTSSSSTASSSSSPISNSSVLFFQIANSVSGSSCTHCP